MNENLISFQEGQPNSFPSLFLFLFLFLHTGIWAEIQMPQTSVNVIKGQMVVLRASYSTEPSSDPSTNTILWNFVSNNSQLVRKQKKDPANSYLWKTLTPCLFICCSVSSVTSTGQQQNLDAFCGCSILDYSSEECLPVLILLIWQSSSFVNPQKLIQDKKEKLKAFIQYKHCIISLLL